MALAVAVGGAEVCVSGHDSPDYGFEHRLVGSWQAWTACALPVAKDRA